MPNASAESTTLGMYGELKLQPIIEQCGLPYEITSRIFNEASQYKISVDEKEALGRLATAYKTIDRKSRKVAIHNDTALYFSIARKMGLDIGSSDGIKQFIEILNQVTDHFQRSGLYEYFSPIVTEIENDMYVKGAGCES